MLEIIRSRRYWELMFVGEVILKLQKNIAQEIPKDDYNLAVEIGKLALNAYKKAMDDL